jgi:hypothetical protein
MSDLAFELQFSVKRTFHGDSLLDSRKTGCGMSLIDRIELYTDKLPACQDRCSACGTAACEGIEYQFAGKREAAEQGS